MSREQYRYERYRHKQHNNDYANAVVDMWSARCTNRTLKPYLAAFTSVCSARASIASRGTNFDDIIRAHSAFLTTNAKFVTRFDDDTVDGCDHGWLGFFWKYTRNWHESWVMTRKLLVLLTVSQFPYNFHDLHDCSMTQTVINCRNYWYIQRSNLSDFSKIYVLIDKHRSKFKFARKRISYFQNQLIFQGF